MRPHRRFWDRAGFGNHCWECVNATDWQGERGRCMVYGMTVMKYDSPNNVCSVGRICTSYVRRGEATRDGK